MAIPALDLLVSGGTDTPFQVSGQLKQSRHPTPPVFGVGRNPNWSVEDRTRLETVLERMGHHVMSPGSCASALTMTALGRLTISFKGAHFPKDVILYADIFYLRYGVPHWDLGEIMAEPGVELGQATLNR